MVQIIVLIVLGILLGLIRYICEEKKKVRITGGELLINAIEKVQYRKATNPNDYKEYAGELEEKDTNEYLEFITLDILNLIK